MPTFKLSAGTVKSSISAHTSLALASAALLYLICLTGTLAVFFEEFERWEQPSIEEYTHYSPQQISISIDHFQQRVPETPKTIWVVLPTKAVPRMHISGDEQEWFINADGSLSAPPLQSWTTMLTKLHQQLHLPQSIGLLFVGILGVILLSLILSGLFSHPKLFKDAFRWRPGRGLLSKVDFHNRLSIWALPFYLMIAFTGAFMALMGLFSVLSAALFYEGDNEVMLESIYGADPKILNAAPTLNFKNAFQVLATHKPEAKPIYLAIQNMNTRQQYFEIAATLPQRLIYSEIYRFQADGSLIDHQGFSDGPSGKQLAYSIYRLHFGHYAGFWVKLIYALLGLALTAICASGINIWLARRKFYDPLNDLWLAVVWGIPLALSVSALLAIYRLPPLPAFCSILISAMAFSLFMKKPIKTRWVFIALISSSLLIIVVSTEYLHHNETLTDTFHLLNGCILSLSFLLGCYLFQYRQDYFDETKLLRAKLG